MARPQSRFDLLDASEASFSKLMALIESLPPEDLAGEFAFDDRDRSVRDVLVHLHEWHRLLIDWVEANLAGEERTFLPGPYTWEDFEPMNVGFRDQHAGTTVDEALVMVGESRARARTLIADRTDEELFTNRYYPWTGTTSLGAHCVSVTSSHDEWAMKKIREHARG